MKANLFDSVDVEDHKTEFKKVTCENHFYFLLKREHYLRDSNMQIRIRSFLNDERPFHTLAMEEND